MPGKQEDVEVSDSNGGPFEPEVSEATRYVIDRWGYVDGRPVIEGRITELFSTITLKRMKYQSDAIDATVSLGHSTSITNS